MGPADGVSREAGEQAQAESAARQRIITAARRHFLTHGFRGVTMDDLAAELGMSKKTLYTHFPSKTALLEAVLHDKFNSLEADVTRVTAEFSSDFAVGLQRLLACIQRHTDEKFGRRSCETSSGGAGAVPTGGGPGAGR